MDEEEFRRFWDFEGDEEYDFPQFWLFNWDHDFLNERERKFKVEFNSITNPIFLFSSKAEEEVLKLVDVYNHSTPENPLDDDLIEEIIVYVRAYVQEFAFWKLDLDTSIEERNARWEKNEIYITETLQRLAPGPNLSKLLLEIGNKYGNYAVKFDKGCGKG